MPNIRFTPGQKDYIEKLNEMSESFDAAHAAADATVQATAADRIAVAEDRQAVNTVRQTVVDAAAAVALNAQSVDADKSAAIAARDTAVTKAGEADDSAVAAVAARDMAIAANDAAAGYAAQAQGVMGVIAGEVRGFCGSVAPAGWALCQGQLLNIVDHPALWAVLGASYGGDGITTFALPIIDSYYPRGARIATIEVGDVFTANLPGSVDATYTALAGDGVNQVAAGLAAAITASEGYTGQAFSVAVVADVITLTAKVAGTGFDVMVTTATAPMLTVVTANKVGVVQVVEITISGIKGMPWPATHRIIYLG